MADEPEYDAATALIVVDVQNDFADPAGALYVEGGEKIVAGINDLVARAREAGATVVMTQDWHPPVTPHFVSAGGTWPTHCVGGTWGAQLHPGLADDADLVLRKGTGGADGYSAFSVADPETEEVSATGLEAYLKARGVLRVVVVGLALDVCVRATAVDAAENGFATTLLPDLSRAVEMSDGDTDAAMEAMAHAGVTVKQ